MRECAEEACELVEHGTVKLEELRSCIRESGEVLDGDQPQLLQGHRGRVRGAQSRNALRESVPFCHSEASEAPSPLVILK